MYVGGREETVYGLDAESGEFHTSVDVGATPSGRVFVSDDTLFLVIEGGVAAVDIEAETSRRVVEGGITMLFDDGTLYASSADGLVAVDAASGETQWRFNRGTKTFVGTLADGTLYTREWHEGGNLNAVDADSGEKQWSLSLGTDALGFLPFVDSQWPFRLGVSPQSLHLIAGPRRGDNKLFSYRR